MHCNKPMQPKVHVILIARSLVNSISDKVAFVTGKQPKCKDKRLHKALFLLPNMRKAHNELAQDANVI